jgi:predicted ArsR family transcriptional regulator
MAFTPDLFATHPVARKSDPETSHAAAASMYEAHKDHHYWILASLWRPMTIYELAKLTGLTHVQVARRMPELEQMGKARATGETRTGDSGRECRLWERIL